jgi:pyruvate formate lyase activating enzyme
VRDALLWDAEGDRIHCRLCPHGCRIPAGKRGICGVRENQDGRLVALTYGMVSSVAADPIEKKPVFHYFPGTSALSLGSIGCTMRCQHCQNWEISRVKPGPGDGLHYLDPDTVADMASRFGCLGVAFTYNEPVIWIEYVHDVAERCQRAGLYTVMVTNGFITRQGLDLIGRHIDVWRVDVKCFDDPACRRLCSIPSARPVLDMAVRAKHHWRMHVEVVTNVIPTVNDDEATLGGIARWIRDELGPMTPWHVTRFFPHLDLAHLRPTPVETLLRARDTGRETGLDFVYLGNLAEPGGEDTTCPSCGLVAVRREGYRILETHVRDGACARCGRSLGITS